MTTRRKIAKAMTTELNSCRLCGKKPQTLVLADRVKIACPTGCKIVEALTLADATYVWNERWYAPQALTHRHD